MAQELVEGVLSSRTVTFDVQWSSGGTARDHEPQVLRNPY